MKQLTVKRLDSRQFVLEGLEVAHDAVDVANVKSVFLGRGDLPDERVHVGVWVQNVEGFVLIFDFHFCVGGNLLNCSQSLSLNKQAVKQKETVTRCLGRFLRGTYEAACAQDRTGCVFKFGGFYSEPTQELEAPGRLPVQVDFVVERQAEAACCWLYFTYNTTLKQKTKSFQHTKIRWTETIT